MNPNKQTTQASGLISINDLREKEYSGFKLSQEERSALDNFDNYRIQYLNSSHTEDEFSKRYLEMQVKANLTPYPEFLKSPYSDRYLNN